MSGLQKQLIQAPFESGVDTKIDPFKPTSKLDVLENGIFVSPGRIRKRNGYEQLTNAILGGGTISTGTAAWSKDDELLVANRTTLYSLSNNSTVWGDQNPNWVSKGTMSSPTVTQFPVMASQYGAAGQDTAVLGNLQAFIWEQWTGGYGATVSGCAWAVVDRATGQIVSGPTALANANAICPRVVALASGAFVFFYVDSSTWALYAYPIKSSTFAANSSPVSLGTIYSGGPRYDVASYLNTANGVFIGGATGAGAIVEFEVYGNGAASTWTHTATTPRSICCFYDWNAVLTTGQPQLVVGYTDGFVTYPNGVAYFTTIWRGATNKAETSLDATITSGSSNITGCSTSSTATAYQFFITGNGNTTQWWYAYVKSVAVGAAYAVGSSTTIARSVGIAGKPLVYQGSVYLPVSLDTGTSVGSQNTSFLINTSGRVVARWFAGTSQGAYRNYSTTISGIQMAPQVVDLSLTPDRFAAYGYAGAIAGSTGLFTLAGAAAYRSITAAGVITQQLGVYGVDIDLEDATSGHIGATLANGLHVGGGAMRGYYAAQTVEHGFNHYPFGISGSAAGGAGNLSAGTYQYAVCFEWTDAYGQIHRSSPSVAYSISAAATNTITLTIPTLRLTDKTGTVGEVQVVVYRTVVGGSTFYQITNLGTAAANALYNSTTANTITYADGAADTAITGNPQIYTTGGVLSNYPPPPMICPIVYRNRIVGIDSTSPLSLWYSKQVIPTAPVEFSAYLTLNIDPRGGPVTALANLDDKLIVFKADRIFVVTGQGPDSTGGQNDFSDAVLVTSDTGCTEPKSIVLTPVGILFKGAKGIYLLDRSLACSYAGAEVEAYNSDSITSAALIANTNQVRFTMSSGIALVLDYLMRQWAVFTPLSAASAVMWAGTYVYLSSSGYIYRETPGVFSDAGAFISLKLTTSWFSFAGTQGFQRLYKILLLGEFDTPHTLYVSLAYNYDTTVAQTTTITPSVGTVPYQWRVFPSLQKCEAVQVTIYDAASVGAVIVPGGPGFWAVTSSVGYQADIGEGYNISGLAFEVGTKQGGFRLPATRSAA